MLTALGELGVNTTSLLASLGVAGLAIGFAAKDTLANFISGVVILMDAPFKVGDLIVIEGAPIISTKRSSRPVSKNAPWMPCMMPSGRVSICRVNF